MKASTLFALTLALLLGLGAAATARYAGLFDKKQPPPPEPPEPAPKVLVAGTTLFEDITVTSQMVIVRELTTPDEIKEYKTNPNRYMPSITSAAHLRVPARTIQANTVLMKTDFKEAGLPESLTTRLSPGYRAINASVMKEKAAGGVIQVGEYVDVYLTAKICTDKACKDPLIRTAPIARGAKIIMKRGSLWQQFATDPDGKPINFTLEVNPYRAALIEYAQGVGQIALVPSQPPTRRGAPFADATSKEYADEDTRVEKLTSGELTVGAPDLHRIFHLVPAAPPKPPHSVVIIEGTKPVGAMVFPPTGSEAPTSPTTPASGVQPAGGFSFAPVDDKECKTCGGKKDEPTVGR